MSEIAPIQTHAHAVRLNETCGGLARRLASKKTVRPAVAPPEPRPAGRRSLEEMVEELRVKTSTPAPAAQPAPRPTAPLKVAPRASGARMAALMNRNFNR